MGARVSRYRVRHHSTLSPSLAYKGEPLSAHRPGGDHPLKPGEILCVPRERYEVLRELGSGVYSTVWLVKSQLVSNFPASGKYASMKVLKAEVSDHPQLHESEYLNRILTADPTHPGFQHNLHLLDEFRLDGPHGRHQCLVTEVLGENLDQYTKRFVGNRPWIPVVKSVVRQVILATMYLHEKCNIIHTDIKTTNIMFTLPEGVLPTTEELPLASATSTVKLIDVGVACWADRVEEHWTDLIHSPELRSPEVVVGAGWGKPTDIWTLGLLVYELTIGKFLIPHTVNEISIPYIHAVSLGPYPRSLTMGGKYSGRFFKPDGSPLLMEPPHVPLGEHIRRCYPGADVDALVHFLESTLRLDPRDRASLQTLLEHPWLAIEENA
ncbi:kinase-like protein [Mycena filopes]|nr:kinase-like protein [Mycena filopes]